MLYSKIESFLNGKGIISDAHVKNYYQIKKKKTFHVHDIIKE